MAKTWGYALSGFASGLSTGFSIQLEKSKIDALKKEQERLEKAEKEAERLFQEWYDSPETKEFCANLDTASQGERTHFIVGARRMGEDIFKYFTEIDNDIREGRIKEAQDKNDLLETKIKSYTDLAALGMTATFPDGSPMKISPEDIEFQKKIQIGKMAGGPTGEAMGMQMWKRRGLEEITPTPKAPGITDYNSAANYLSKFKASPPDVFNRIKTGFQSQFPNIDMAGITQESLREPEKPIPEGEITAGEKRTWDMASSVLFGSSDFVTGISKPGIISTMISSKLNMGDTLTEEENTEVRNNYNAIKGTLPSEVLGIVESQLKRYGIPLEAPEPEPVITPEPEPKRWWEFWKGETPTVTPAKTAPITPGVTPKVGEIPTPKVPTGAKEAMIPMMSKKELEEAIKGLDPSDPMYKLLYDEAIKRGYIKK
ncbi:hypothetical protein ES695_02165 [Candidatus Atribacteria bacterium 1244-E10-H5-B2]|nr:MAG: hypothetical protein ES695_02165 [Candidatus Atribacteria bacterium 1244-E10-H5-B2]